MIRHILLFLNLSWYFWNQKVTCLSFNSTWPSLTVVCLLIFICRRLVLCVLLICRCILGCRTFSFFGLYSIWGKLLFRKTYSNLWDKYFLGCSKDSKLSWQLPQPGLFSVYLYLFVNHTVPLSKTGEYSLYLWGSYSNCGCNHERNSEQFNPSKHLSGDLQRSLGGKQHSSGYFQFFLLDLEL